MYEELNAQLAEARERLDRLSQLRASLAPAREQLATEAHRVRQIENCLDEVEEKIKTLESFSFQSLLDSLLWKKEGKLNYLREELARLEPACETGERTLLELDAAVKEMEAEIAALSDAEKTYKDLCDQKCEQILSDHSESAVELEGISAQLNGLKSERQALRKCLQLGKNLIERILSRNKALGRVENKMMHGGPLGVLGAVAVNAVHRKTAAPVINRAREGLGEFAHCLETLPMAADSERDRELVRMASVLAQSGADLNGNETQSVLIDLIHQAQGLVQSKLDEVEPIVASLEVDRTAIIERA